MRFTLKNISSLFGVALVALSFSQSAYADKLDDIKKELKTDYYFYDLEDEERVDLKNIKSLIVDGIVIKL